MWEDLILSEIKITCTVKSNLNLSDGFFKLDPTVIAPASNRNMLMFKDWNYKTHNTDTLNISTRTRALRDTQIRSVHKVGEMKKAHKLRVDEVSKSKNN